MHQLGNIEVLRNDKSPAELAQVLFDDNGGFLINNKKPQNKSKILLLTREIVAKKLKIN